MPRHTLKRGKQIKKSSISSEQVCIATAIDRNGNIILEAKIFLFIVLSLL